MKQFLLFIIALLYIGFDASASDENASQLYKNVQQNFKQTAPISFSLFKQSSLVYQAGSVSGIEKAVFLNIDPSQNQQLFNSKPETIRLSIPSPENSEIWILELYRSQILTNDFQVKTSDGKSYNAPDAVYYQGIFNNDPHSMAVVSIFENQVVGMLSNEHGNYDLGLYGQNQTNEYVFYRSNELSRKLPFDCHTSDANQPVSTAAVASDCRIVRVYIECDYDLYTKRTSSIPNVTTFVTGFFNQVAAIYTNESITVQISEIYVWTSTDPFISQATSSGVLSAFRTTRTSFNGNIAHLISTRSTNLGGVAYLDVLCGTSYKHAFSNIYNSYGSFPTYSWTVNCFAHEMGHNFGSNHTQWCGWTGGALDNCYTTEGGCAAGPAPVNGGTIMSYCHITSYGVNLANGFGTQPGNVILTKYSSATCLSGGATISISPATATICSGSSITLTASGGSTYSWTPTTGLNVSNAATVSANPSTTTTYTASSTVNNCTSTASRTVTVLPTVNRGTLASGDQTFIGSGDPTAISFSTAATGGSGSFAYQWYSKAGIQAAPTGTSTTGWTLISGATSSTYNPGIQTSSISYAVTVDATGTTDCGGLAWASGVRQITVNVGVFNPGILVDADQTFCSTGGDPVSIGFSVAPSGASSYSYQWYYQNGIVTDPTGSSTTGWTIINGATASSYDPTPGLTQSRTYVCRVTPSPGTASWANGSRQITVLPAFNPGTVTSADQSFCTSGNPASITLSTNPVGSGGYTWRWYFKESSAAACPTGNSITGWSTNSSSTNISGTTLSGAGITFDPISAGTLNNGRTFAVLITPIANGNIPACGTAAWANNCRKTFVTSCIGTMPGEEQIDAKQPELGQSFPNPTNSNSTIVYSLPESFSGAHIIFYDQLGRILADQLVPTGIENTFEFKGEFFPSGTYYYSLVYAGTKLATKKLVLIH